jgi:hypothetical protein
MEKLKKEIIKIFTKHCYQDLFDEHALHHTKWSITAAEISSLFDDIRKDIEERIKHFKKVEWEYFDKSLKTNIPQTLKTLYRNTSNQFEARRQELESILTKLPKQE